MDVMQSSPTIPQDGVYLINRTDIENNQFPVFCDFEAPNRAWTLIETFSLENNADFKDKPFTILYRVNQQKPTNWPSFRFGQSKMKYIRSNSSLFRATCDYPNRNGSLVPDLLIGSLSNLDIVNEGDFGECRKFRLINIRGHQCTNCFAYVIHGKSPAFHLHLDVTWNYCDFVPPFQTQNEDLFGFYSTTGNGFKCTETPQSTTQWWLGQER